MVFFDNTKRPKLRIFRRGGGASSARQAESSIETTTIARVVWIGCRHMATKVAFSPRFDKPGWVGSSLTIIVVGSGGFSRAQVGSRR